jgi:hypothetical protein
MIIMENMIQMIQIHVVQMGKLPPLVTNYIYQIFKLLFDIVNFKYKFASTPNLSRFVNATNLQG